MYTKEPNNNMFILGYQKEVKEKRPCYAGVCWAKDTLKQTPSSEQLSKVTRTEASEILALAEDARCMFLELYAFAVKELGEEAIEQFSAAIQEAEDRKTWHGRVEKKPAVFRERGHWCKQEIKELETFRQTLLNKK